MYSGELTDIFERMNHLHVVVVGDVMLDKYWWGDVERMSPEAPVPVVSLKKRESRLGGAANVALNCKALGAKVTLASVLGDDYEGRVLDELTKEAGINTLFQHSKHRPTVTKTRVIAHNNHVIRVDDEITDDLTMEEEHPFIDMVLRFLQIEKPDVLIFEDYNKGVLKENVIGRITEHCNHLNIITAVDPKRNNFLSYKNVTIFKPNLKEVREGLGTPLADVTEQELGAVHNQLKQVLKHHITFITLSEKGVYYNNSKSGLIPSHLRTIADVSGAGDTVIATAALVYTITKDAGIMAAISNIAGGLVCEQVGVVPIDKQVLLKECQELLA